MKSPIMRETARGRSISAILVFLSVAVGASCSMMKVGAGRAEADMPRVVRIERIIEGDKWVCNYPPSWCATARPNRPMGILARDGDLFFFGPGKHFFLYRGTDGESLVLDAQGDVVLLNGKAVSVDLNRATSWEWLRKASTEELSGLRVLMIGPQTDALDFTLLEKVARARPDVGLFLGKEVDQPDDVVRLLSLFEPDFLAINRKMLSEQFAAIEPRLAKLEVLWALEEGPLDFLPRLPHLHTLLLNRWEPAKSGGIPGSRNLRSVTIMEANAEDLSFLRNLTGLQELILWGVDVKDTSALAAFPDLKKLVFFLGGSNNVVDLSVLDRLPKLTWLGFPGNTTQETFAHVIAGHPDLEVVELGSEDIRDLSPLRSLRHLNAAIVPLKNVDVGVLQELKSLRYLALVHKGAFESDTAEKTAALEKALPDTFVAQAEPYCLGSGWILLLVPAIVLLRCLWPRGIGPRSEAHA